MRVVENEAEFESQMNRAISEALNALRWFCFYRKVCSLLVISKFKSWQIATEIFCTCSNVNVVFSAAIKR
jgi:hypothetical protein